MPLALDEYRVKLINQVLFAKSQEEVKRLIEATIRSIEDSKVNDELVCHFLDDLISDLKLFNPMKKDAQQWSNIMLAKILLLRVRRRMDTPAH